MNELEKCKILVIDDELSIRESFVAHLEDLDYEIYQAENGRVGIERIQELKPDLILVDLRMPEIDGHGVLQWTGENTPETPVIVISGTGLITDAVDALRLGAWDYLLKPVEDLNVLTHAVNSVLEKARLIKQNEEYKEHLEQLVEEKTKELRKVNKNLVNVNQRLQQIVDTASTLSGITNIEDFRKRFLEEFGRHMIASGGSLYIIQKDGLKLVHTLDPGHAPEFINFPLAEHTLFKKVLEEKKPVLVEDIFQDSEVESSGWKKYKNKSSLVFPLPDENGNIFGLLALHNKIKPPFLEQDKEIGSILTTYGSETLRAVHAIEALKESEEKYRLLVESANQIILVISLNGTVRFINHSSQSLFGRDPEYIINKNISELFSSNVRTEIQERIDTALCNVQQVSSILEVQDYNDNRKWFDVRIQPIISHKNPVTNTALVIMADITDRILIEEALLASEAKFRAIFEYSPIMIQLLDTNGMCLLCNREYKNVSGWTDEELKSNDPLEFMIKDKSTIDSAREALLSTDGVFKDYVTKTNSGETRYQSWASFRLPDESILFVGNDITEKRKAEEQNELIQQQLNQAQKLEAIGRLAGGVAHDFNNMLSPILGYGELLLDEFSENNKTRSVLMEIRKAALRSRDLTQQLLAFGRKQTLEMKTFNLNKAVKDFRKLIRRTLREDIELELNLCENENTIKADIGQLDQVLMNLVINAQDAMPDGGKLRISTRLEKLKENQLEKLQDLTPGSYMVLTVADSGLGIPKELMDRIFEPFFTTKEAGKGTGLGLATVYGIMKQHGGGISVQSESGKGTEFEVYLPSADAPPEDYNYSESEKVNSDGKETILVAEDQEVVRNLVCNILKKQGFQTITASTAEDVIKTAENYEGKIHLLLSDLVMPGINGKQLYEKLKEKREKLKVLYMSGYTGDVIAHHGILDEGTEFIQKPFTIKSLSAKIKEVLQKD